MAAQTSDGGPQAGEAARGLQGILVTLEKFLQGIVQGFQKHDSADARKAVLTNLEANSSKGLKLCQTGQKMIRQMIHGLQNTDKLLKRVPGFEQGFQTASKGLRGIGDLTEEATTKIQDNSEKIQASLEELTTALQPLVDDESISKETQEKIAKAMGDIENGNNQVFEIMMELQFQDILRQQLSAVVMILNKTKESLGKSLELIGGQPLAPWKDMDPGVVTDESVLDNSGTSQDDVDEIMKNHS
jgi:chemotaxis regulatin CheY-phosphate phosphatase CheZ